MRRAGSACHPPLRPSVASACGAAGCLRGFHRPCQPAAASRSPRPLLGAGRIFGGGDPAPPHAAQCGEPARHGVERAELEHRRGILHLSLLRRGLPSGAGRLALVAGIIALACVVLLACVSPTYMNFDRRFRLFRCMAGFFTGVVAYHVHERFAQAPLRPSVMGTWWKASPSPSWSVRGEGRARTDAVAAISLGAPPCSPQRC